MTKVASECKFQGSALENGSGYSNGSLSGVFLALVGIPSLVTVFYSLT